MFQISMQKLKQQRKINLKKKIKHYQMSNKLNFFQIKKKHGKI